MFLRRRPIDLTGGLVNLYLSGNIRLVIYPGALTAEELWAMTGLIVIYS